VKDAGIQAIENNYSHYTPVPGIPELRAAVAAKFRRENQLDYQPSQIIVSTGAKQSIANAVLALVNPGDEVIVPAPYWVSYVDLVEFAGGKVVAPVAGLETGFKQPFWSHIQPIGTGGTGRSLAGFPRHLCDC
jgi:aspartate aminotransferase